MRLPGYRANFCAACGNRLGEWRWWELGCFCAVCAARRGRLRPTWLLALTLGGALGLWLGHRPRETALDRLAPLGSPAPPPVSAHDATAQAKPPRPRAPITFATCGARTRRGTPCRHRTAPGERCAQHRGQPSMLEPDSPR
jgi:hypothetical protein